MQPAPQTVSFIQRRSGQWNALTCTGILQIVIAAITVALGIACVTIPLGYRYSRYISSFLHIIGYPIWCGVLFFLTAGILGIISGCKKSSHVAVSYLVLSSFACLASVCVIGLSSTDLSVIVENSPPSRYDSSLLLPFGFDITLIVLGVGELITSIIGIVMAGMSVYSKSQHQTMMRYQTLQQVELGQVNQGVVGHNPSGQP